MGICRAGVIATLAELRPCFRVVVIPSLRQIVVAENVEKNRCVAAKAWGKRCAGAANQVVLIGKGVNSPVQSDTSLQFQR